MLKFKGTVKQTPEYRGAACARSASIHAARVPFPAPADLPDSRTPRQGLPKKPELLAPAGDWECLQAAIENGSDAVYFGLDRFNARMRATNFTMADLPDVMRRLHLRGLRGYVTFNTLVFPDEMEDAESFLRSIMVAGVDAAIVQDVGICRLIRALSPDFPIHASTQMTITSAAGVAFARSVGADLVVLARENSIGDVSRIREELADGPNALPLEVFVHGALCVAFSGQCLTSESLGGRSANRGECAQACRLPYELVSDGRDVDLGDRRYLLSPQDLAGIGVLKELIRAGVASLKIEGRLKSPEYVAGVTRVYRQALDAAWGEEIGQPTGRPDAARARYELEMSFSRGLYPGWFHGTNNRELVHARFGTKRGVYLGVVTQVGQEHAAVALESDLRPGDGVVFDRGRPDEKEEGGRVYSVERSFHGDAILKFGRGAIDWSRVREGNRLWKTSDPALKRELRGTFTGESLRSTRPLDLEVHGHANSPLIVFARDEMGHSVRVDSAATLSAAHTQPLRDEVLRAQLGRLGGTPFHLGRLQNRVEGEVIIPLSELNQMRRRIVSEIEQARVAPLRWTVLSPEDVRRPSLTPSPSPAREPALVAVIRQAEQLEAAWQAGVRTVYCEFENPKHYRETVRAFRDLAAGTPGKPEIWVAPPRIFLPGEDWIIKQVRSCEADGYLVRNPDHLRAFAGDRKRGDFSLNVANPWSAEHFIGVCGLERVTASYDLNAGQLAALLRDSPPDWYDITVHQRMPMFHMNHCVFCAFLSDGKDYRDCGRPCDSHAVALRDRVGALLPLKADAGCRNTVFNNRAQTGAEFLKQLLEAGARSFRVEFVTESPDEVRHTLERYQALLEGRISGAELWKELKLINQIGVTRGQLGG
jgi:putative protease